jgi:uncharacterized protein YbjT (DUF2867 family)
MNRRIVVLGASGNIGKHVCRKIKEDFPQDTLVKVSRTQRENEGWIAFNPWKDDWQILGKADVLVNCIGSFHESPNDDFERVHVGLIRLIIEHKALLGNPKIIHLSALGASVEHPIPFMQTKGRGEDILRKQQDIVIFRPSIVCFPGALLVTKMLKLVELSRYSFNRAILPSDFSQTKIQPVMIDDLTSAISKALFSQSTNNIIDAVGKDTIALGWLLDAAAKSGGKSIIPIEIPNSLVGAVTRNFVSVWFPGLITYDQFQLLLTDNISDSTPFNEWLGYESKGTKAFWINAFKSEK